MSSLNPPSTGSYIETSPKRVRVFFAGRCIVDTLCPKLVWEIPNYPVYYFSRESWVDGACSLQRSAQAQAEEGTIIHDLIVGDQVAKEAVTEFTGEGKYKERAGLHKLRFASADAWFEEDERIYVHPKDPYKRIDILQTSRHIRVEVNGVEVANTRRAQFLLETGLRRRIYIPIMDVKMECLKASDTVTACPYKGWANYFDVKLPNGEVHKDVAWYYRTPNPECCHIAGRLCFYHEKDKLAVCVDGVKQE